MNWFLWLITGVLSVLAGVFALANPFAATLTAEFLTGVMFTLIGILMLVSAFQFEGWWGRILTIVIGILTTMAGINLITNPLAGVIALTLLTAVFLLVIGCFRVILAFSADAGGARWYLAIAGVLAIVMSIMIMNNFPQSSTVVLGLFLAVDLISNGVSLIMLSLIRRKEADV